MSNIITKIEVQKRNKDRVNVYIDEEFNFACSSELIYYHNLKKGKVIDENSLNDIIKEDNYIKAKGYALKYIEKSLKTESQVKEKLYLKEYDEDIVNKVIRFLKDYNFIDDDKYCDMYIREKLNIYGRNKIKYTLLNKGVKENIVIEKINNINEEKEKKVAYKLAEKKYKIMILREKDKFKIYKKIWPYIISRGYNSNIAEWIINELKSNEALYKDNSICLDEQNMKLSQNIENNIKDENIEKFHNNSSFNSKNNSYKENIDILARKRYDIIIKSEDDKNKIYRRLSNYLLRRGFSFEEVKKSTNRVLYERE
ncbi:recombination regulator RecX [Clostridium botulinum]|uniref:recombination regulator RecX n=1 Tax=Clostridium botulinum TaxID=1491 RepID=UPI0007E03BE9|nr:recombination regulator RecX [Clostridium botulinum]KEI84606.1 recombination regulator RecX [Clostridium botulinum B2 267]MBY6801691.1 recombination regulator RecX [Clostridium botulinum]MBY6998741.1 recombination regulator RecX [Clostridium botulinum]MBY7012809.1 recombination regulator RecX [Clostridium botulinum]MCR1155155.1 recombination regulator RecX [Clostridium botulinum]